jgi:hypothetical protein
MDLDDRIASIKKTIPVEAKQGKAGRVFFGV